jgi:hypothetical protein
VRCGGSLTRPRGMGDHPVLRLLAALAASALGLAAALRWLLGLVLAAMAFALVLRRLLRLVLRAPAAVVGGRISQDGCGPGQTDRCGGREEEIALHVFVS